MYATNINWDVDFEEDLQDLPEEIKIPKTVAPYIRHIGDVKPDYNFLMGYEVGVPKKWWYGIEGITFIFMGAWNDPPIGYKDYAFDCYLIEDAMFESYHCECPEECADDDKGFEEYMLDHSDLVFEMLDDLIGNMKENVSNYISDQTGFCHNGFTISSDISVWYA